MRGVCVANTIAIACNSPTNAVFQTPYSSDMGVSGCTSGCVSQTVTPVPPNMTFDGLFLSGYAAFPQVYSFTVTVVDGIGFNRSRLCTLDVTALPLSLPCSNLQLILNQSMGFFLSASGGVAPYTYSAEPGLPSGVALQSDGFLFGTPGVGGPFTMFVTVVDSTSARLRVQCDGFVSVAPTVQCPPLIFAVRQTA